MAANCVTSPAAVAAAAASATPAAAAVAAAVPVAVAVARGVAVAVLLTLPVAVPGAVAVAVAFAVVATLTGVVAVVAAAAAAAVPGLVTCLLRLCMRALPAFPLWYVVLGVIITCWPRRTASNTGRIATANVAVSLAAALAKGQSGLPTIREVATHAFVAPPWFPFFHVPVMVQKVRMGWLALAAVSGAAC